MSVALLAFIGLLYGASPASAQTRPSLGKAETFAVLGASTVTNTGSSVITGDLGLHPGTAVTGFPAGKVVKGTKHAANSAALEAQNAVTAAYNHLVNQSCTQNLTGQNLGGKTLTAGVYCFAAAAGMTGTLTLNGQGNPDAVFIFKMGSTVTTASASKVKLINKADAKNVFWQVGSSATLGTTTAFVGNILALASITVTTGVSVDGRMLARTGAVTLDTNAIKVPKPPPDDTNDNSCKSEDDNDRENGAAIPAATWNAPPSVKNRSAHIVEYDLPAQADANPGAMIVDTLGHDNNRLWFVTRIGGGVPRVYRFDPSKKLMQGNASWKSWALAESLSTGGAGMRKIKASCDRRYIFVRTSESLQRIDTGACNGTGCERTEWDDQSGTLNVSDLAIDDQNKIFTTGIGDPADPSTSYVQMLTPGTYPGNGNSATATVTRWTVGGGAGLCEDIGSFGGTTSFPCVSGIAVDPSNRNIVYYAEPFGQDGLGNIAALNIKTNTVRRWSMSVFPADELGPVKQPRQLMVDRFAQVWVITGSGHLVSLDNKRQDRMRKHAIPLGAFSDPFGLAPDDDVVGYTDAGLHKVGMLFAKGPSFSVDPDSTSVVKISLTKAVLGSRAGVTSGVVPPMGKVVEATITTKADGVFVEAHLNSAPPGNPSGPINDSLSPLGITANRGKGQGTFFYAVGVIDQNPTANRVGFVRLPMPEKVRRPRDDDDDSDGFDDHDHPGHHNGHDDHDGDSDSDDDDRDGLENEHDSPGHREKTDVPDDKPLGGGELSEYTVATSASSLALIATAKADNPLSAIQIEIYDAAGNLRANSLPTPGKAVATLPLPAVGNYLVKVRNNGGTGIVHTSKLIVREPHDD